MTEEKGTTKFRKIPTRQILLIGGAFILGFIILGVIVISVWDYSNSVAFCANFCHDVHPEEIDAFQDSYHASIKCVECHMGRVGTIHNIFLKASHFRHLPEVIFDQYDRPLESETLRPVNESCYLCHWPESFHGDRVVEIGTGWGGFAVHAAQNYGVQVTTTTISNERSISTPTIASATAPPTISWHSTPSIRALGS